MDNSTYFVGDLNEIEQENHLNIMTKLRTQPCPYQTEYGVCELYQKTKKKGDGTQHDCFYYHNESERRRNPIVDGKKELYRPAHCKYYSVNHKCEYGQSCKYCHGYQELLFHPSIYKTKICKFKDNNYEKCPSGKYCCYSHGDDDLRKPSTVTTTDKKKNNQQRCVFSVQSSFPSTDQYYYNHTIPQNIYIADDENIPYITSQSIHYMNQPLQNRLQNDINNYYNQQIYNPMIQQQIMVQRQQLISQIPNQIQSQILPQYIPQQMNSQLPQYIPQQRRTTPIIFPESPGCYSHNIRYIEEISRNSAIQSPVHSPYGQSITPDITSYTPTEYISPRIITPHNNNNNNRNNNRIIQQSSYPVSPTINNNNICNNYNSHVNNSIMNDILNDINEISDNISRININN